jgi:hypothetical protein
MPCEDYPCCGHEAGDCPTHDAQGNERWTCTECGRRLPLHASSSICNKCRRRLERRWDEGMDY